jgi:bacillithiol biosynthesis deacetylase BshB1
MNGNIGKQKIVDIIAFAPHPDDAEIGCGGLLIAMKKKGCRTGIIDLTRGELSSNGNLETRKKETRRATEILMLDLRENLDMSDGNIECNMQNKLKIIYVLRKYTPKIVLFPYLQDRHPDHENSSKLIKDAVFLSGLSKLETDMPAYRPNIVLNYMLHYEFNPSFIVDITEHFEEKVQAIKAYGSQFFSGDSNQAITHISTKAFKEILYTRARYFGLKIRAGYGEPYFINSKIKINDPLSFFDYVVY